LALRYADEQRLIVTLHLEHSAVGKSTYSEVAIRKIGRRNRTNPQRGLMIEDSRGLVFFNAAAGLEE
jgi:hypothetical protein